MKLYRIMSWVIALTLAVCASAQTDTKRAFRMYMHDGSVQFFFYSDIKSMTVGYEDGDVDCPVQIINTSDSVYTFPMADIDSVSFARPVTEYKSNVVRLEDGLLPYVIACDSLTLTFRPDVPRELFPPVGGHMVTFESNEILPSGFIGTLEQLKEEGNVVAECSFPDVTDVFDNLFFAMGENTQSSQPHVNMNKTQWIHDDNIEVRPIGFKLPDNEWPAPSIGWGNLSGSYTNTAGFNLTTEKFRARLFMLVESGEASFSFTSTGKHTLTLEASEYVDASISDNLPVVTVNVPIPNCPLLALGMNFGLCYSLGVGGGYNFKSEIPFTSVLHFSGGIKDVGNHWGSATNIIATTGKLIFGTPATHLLGEGSITAELGIYGSIDVHPKFWKNSIKNKLALSAGLRTGWRFSTALPDYVNTSSIENANTDLYDSLNGKDVYKLERFFTGYISLENGFNDSNLEIPWDINIDSPVWSGGVVPEFLNVSLTKTESPGTFRADATLKRKIASYAKTGFALYDDSNKLVEQWWDNTTYTNQEGTRITHDFSNLKTCVNYTLHPIVGSLNQEMVANPSSNAKIVSTVITGDAVVTANSASLLGWVNELSEADDYSSGFYYGTEPYVDTMNSAFLPADIQENGYFLSELENLNPDTKYYYRACSNINGEMILAEETMSFTTKAEDEIELDLSGTEVWLSPVSAYLVFPNISSKDQADVIKIYVYSDPEMSSGIMQNGNIYVIYNENDGVGYSKHIWGLKPSTNYWYKVYNCSSYPFKTLITGSFTTTTRVEISTPEVIFDNSHHNENISWESIICEHGNEIGGIIRTARVKFESPVILSGVSSDLFVFDTLSSYYPGHGDESRYDCTITKGIIYSDSSNNLTFLNPDISESELYYESGRFWGISEDLKPGTYYYRSYYKDSSGCRTLYKDDGTRVIIGPNGEEIGPPESDEVYDKMSHISSCYGEIKEFTIPEIVYF